MPEDLSIPRLLPIGTILFHLLFLLVAIPIEAYVLHHWLKFDKKTSTFYAISINLFSSVIGWIMFFMVEPILPIQAKSELISYVFFNQFKSPNIHTFVIFTAFIIFFTTFLLKFLLLKVLLISLNELGIKKVEESETSQRQRGRRLGILKLQNANLITTTLIANSLSYTAIALVILIRGR
ncbi:filament integrity protein FraC [Cylindrospermum sp. FACHB-282]|uniref:filament integrity protein FraC n=1 Tax=Cylindrospermum sp. FACHB-282 TaxID=2692794 RepID=UPI0016885278|nr:filament integrity protein FraC [Cylindrospermum sp. FACHB-282]MBD2387069.1 filament integrity protein fraC [Cylindrospermum sp. FACHB-282]